VKLNLDALQRSFLCNFHFFGFVLIDLIKEVINNWSQNDLWDSLRATSLKYVCVYRIDGLKSSISR
jgi:hypothetical protein